MLATLRTNYRREWLTGDNRTSSLQRPWRTPTTILRRPLAGMARRLRRPRRMKAWLVLHFGLSHPYRFERMIAVAVALLLVVGGGIVVLIYGLANEVAAGSPAAWLFAYVGGLVAHPRGTPSAEPDPALDAIFARNIRTISAINRERGVHTI